MEKGKMNSTALLIGNSDGIGLATTMRLLTMGWSVIGISKSNSTIVNDKYVHHIADVSSDAYQKILKKIIAESEIQLCIYFVGMGELFDLIRLEDEQRVIDINLTSMVKTIAEVLPKYQSQGRGHFIGLSSVADELLSSEAPSYHASKAGFSSYLESIALALKSTDIKVTNVRFGFVDTKMAKGDVRPFMMTIERSVDHIIKCIKKQPIRYTAPKIVIPLIKFRRIMMKFGAK